MGHSVGDFTRPCKARPPDLAIGVAACRGEWTRAGTGVSAGECAAATDGGAPRCQPGWTTGRAAEGVSGGIGVCHGDPTAGVGAGGTMTKRGTGRVDAEAEGAAGVTTAAAERKFAIYVAWIERYAYLSRQHLPDAPRQSEGFLRAFQERGRVSRGLRRENSAARPGDFMGTIDDAIVNCHDAVYFSGHGSGVGPFFDASPAQSGLDFTRLQWGGLLRLVVLDCCRLFAWTLDFDPSTDEDHVLGLWRPAFHGVAYVLGFASYSISEPHRGRYLAEYLLDGLPVHEAWKRACQETSAAIAPLKNESCNWAYLRAGTSGPGADSYNATWDELTARETDPAEPDYLVWMVGHC
ncbi:DUF6345 domain-containing protein [Sorangium cellulosum]|uniref:DUF6345 domain-containing protein n=1 Tax=Sorangium cellulosum TaxID=56 RepID=UPI003D9A3E57